MASTMPRFSDLFIYESKVDGPVITYNNCYLIKDIQGVPDHVDTILFDIEGMALMVPRGNNMLGPFCLTTKF
jgi:hypothetical protein